MVAEGFKGGRGFATGMQKLLFELLCKFSCRPQQKTEGGRGSLVLLQQKSPGEWLEVRGPIGRCPRHRITVGIG